MKKELSLVGLSVLVLFLLIARGISAQEIIFGPSIRVDDDTTDASQSEPSMALYSDSCVYLAWHDLRYWTITGKTNIYFSSSFDGGKTWGRNLNITDNSTPYPLTVDIEADKQGTIYLVWGDEAVFNIYFAMSSDSGKSWSKSVMVNDLPGYAGSPSLTVDNDGTIYVTWSDDRYDALLDVYFAKSVDQGSTWTNPAVRVNDWTSGFQGFSNIAVHKTTPDIRDIYVSWTDSRDGHGEVFFSKSLDGGEIWEENVRVSDGDWASKSRMCVDNEGVIHIACQGRRPDGNLTIFYGYSNNSGNAWYYKMISADTFDLQHNVDIVTDRGDNLYTVWKATPFLSGSEPDYHIYFAMSQDGGQTWSEPLIRVDDTTMAGNHSPRIAVANDGRIRVTWSGCKQTIDDENIYFSWGQGPDWLVWEDEDDPPIPRFSLRQNYPNPLNSTTAISYQLSALSGQQLTVSLKIYNILGKEVITLVDKKQKAGSYRVVWDGRDNQGKEVSSGIYFCRLEVRGERLKATKTKRMVLIR